MICREGSGSYSTLSRGGRLRGDKPRKKGVSKTTPTLTTGSITITRWPSFFSLEIWEARVEGLPVCLLELSSERTLKVGQSLWPPFCFEAPLSEISPPFA